MTNKLFLLTAWIAANPVKVRFLVFAFLVALALTAILVPGMAVLAGDATGGSH